MTDTSDWQLKQKENDKNAKKWLKETHWDCNGAACGVYPLVFGPHLKLTFIETEVTCPGCKLSSLPVAF